MLNLFIRKKLFELNPSLNSDHVNVEKVIFCESSSPSPQGISSLSQNNSSHEHSISKVYYRFLLSCDDNKLLLCQVKDINFENVEQVWIPTDPAKGKIVSFSFNSVGNECIILTDQTYIYKISFEFRTYYDSENEIERKLVEKDAQIIRSCPLSRPSAILWWDRTRYSTAQASVAIVGNKVGQISLVDLETQKEIRQLTVPFGVESLEFYDEIYCRTLLINCSRNFQYFVTLEQSRNAAKKARVQEPSATSSALQYGLYLMNNSPSNRDDNDRLKSIFDNTVKAQAISIKEEEKKIKDAENNKTFDEFIEIFENDLLITLWPQEASRLVYLVKQCKLGFEFDPDNSSSPKSTISSEFCSISKKERNFEIYEFSSKEFCSEKLFLNSATKYFYVGLNSKSFIDSDSVYDSRFLKIVNCGERFMALVFTKFVVIVSKNFAEQRSLSGHSPRSPLVLKKSDSFRNSGSFRRKNYSAHNTVTKSSSLPLTSVVETFTPNDSSPIFDSNDEILNVFYISKPVTSPSSSCSICSAPEPSSSRRSDVERIFKIEVSSVQHKLHDDIRKLFVINEQFLVLTKNGTSHFITCKEWSFGDYFHNRICELLSFPNGEQTPCLDGDIITNAKYIVDCFVTRTNYPNFSKYYCCLNQNNISPQNRFTTWQFWITRSGLILLEELSKVEFNDDQFRRILRLFELARTPRRRVITSLIYFGFWKQALYFLKKYFETSILQELNGEERLFLSHQMFDCLLKNLDDSKHSNDTGTTNHCLEELLKFLKDYFSYYDIGLIFEKLIDKNLFDVAKYVGKVNYSHVQLFEIVLKNVRTGKNKICLDDLIDIFSHEDSGYFFLLSTCYPTEMIVDSRIFSLDTFDSYFDFILKNITNFSPEQLKRIEGVLDPTKIHTQMMFQKIITYAEEGWVFRSQETFKGRRDIINLYLFILLVSLNREIYSTTNGPRVFSAYDWDFLSNIRDNFNSYKLPELIPKSEPKTRTFICCGAYFSLLAINDCDVNRVFVWGRFPYSHPKDSSTENSVRASRTPIMLKFFTYLLPPGALHSMAAGAQHILFLTDFGIYALGSSTYGQLGLGVSYRRTRLPAPIKKFSISNPNHVKIVKIACGSYHSLAVSDCGQLYAWGWALHGQIGNGTNEDVFSPIRIDYWDQLSVKVIDVAAGYAHSVVLCDNGDLYVFGDNSYNQLGVDLEPNITKVTAPVRMCKLRFGTVRLICCGLYHTVAVSVDDECEQQKLFSWGLDPKTWRLKMRSERKSDPSVRTNANLKDFSSPMEINLDCLDSDRSSRIVKICAGQAHNVLLTDDGRVLSFGFGREGQLGLGPDLSNSRVSARIVPELSQVTDISVGVVHSLAVTENALWGWGQNAEMNSFASPSDDCEQPVKSGRTYQEEYWSSKLASYQRNNESIPYKIVEFEKLIQNSVKSNPVFSAVNSEDLYFPESSDMTILDKAKMCIIRFSDELDIQQCLGRFKTFKVTQLSSILYFAKNEFLKCYQYQMDLLLDDIRREPCRTSPSYEKYFDEMKSLAIFFMETLPNRLNSLSGVMFHSYLSILFQTWNDITETFKDNSLDGIGLRRMLSELYLSPGGQHITTPYFGLNLMRIINFDESLRVRFDLDDQFVLDVLTMTANLTQQHQSDIVQFQVFIEELKSVSSNASHSTRSSAADIDGETASAGLKMSEMSLHKDGSATLSSSETDKSNLSFPLELVWRKNLAMLLKED